MLNRGLLAHSAGSPNSFREKDAEFERYSSDIKRETNQMYFACKLMFFSSLLGIYFLKATKPVFTVGAGVLLWCPAAN